MRVWTVCDPKAGTLTQCLGVANYLDESPHQVLLEGRIPRWAIGPLSPYRKAGRQNVDAIISCGFLAPPHVASISKATQKKPFRVHLQTPEPEFEDTFEMVFISRYRWQILSRVLPTYHQMIGVPHRIKKVELDHRRTAAREALTNSSDDRVAIVLVGGRSQAYDVDAASVSNLSKAIVALAGEGWTVLVSTSRRTDPSVLNSLLKLQNGKIKVWDRTGPNPYLDYLAVADAFLITKDSITMVCEALSTGRPVYTFDLTRIPGEKWDEYEWFHRDLSDTLGLTRPFNGTLRAYDYEPLDETRRIAREISAAYETSKT